MTAQERLTQLRVGIFVAIGLLAIALMVVYFGRFGESFSGYYRIRVEYPNASGIYKGASVLLAGAKIGSVEHNPVILPNMDGVYVTLKIYEEVKIPSAAQFTIGSSGLLGDRFIQIVLGKDASSSPPLDADAIVKGKGESGFGDVTEQAGVLLTNIQEAVGNINKIAQKLNNDVFKEATIENLDTTLSNLKEMSASFVEASKKVDGVVTKAEGAIETGKESFASAKETFASAKSAADELKKTIIDLRALVLQAKQGRGALGALLSDREMAENLRALVANLRRHGILWYKDRAEAKPSSR
ncbi:MAG TPA: MlaD family protein [Terrimicrobiaceae bacterium]|nr:MlaD family protein [Terrimicrobiaceae bacterium]